MVKIPEFLENDFGFYNKAEIFKTALLEINNRWKTNREKLLMGGKIIMQIKIRIIRLALKTIQVKKTYLATKVSPITVKK